MAKVSIIDSATAVTAQNRGEVVVTGSHGGLYAAFAASKHLVRAAVFNDAGIGMDESGIEGLRYLDAIDVPAVTVDYRSARIGDAQDTFDRGVISHVNDAARRLGCVPGQECRSGVKHLQQAAEAVTAGPVLTEGRFLLHQNECSVWGLDSASLVRSSDAGSIIVAGSHGGLLGGRPEKALQVDARGAVFHDAGIGCEQAGVGRLAVLQDRGMAAAVVHAVSARIGDARSIWETGLLSRVNAVAASLGVRSGMTVKQFAERVAADASHS